jgi:hypothetical protein
MVSVCLSKGISCITTDGSSVIAKFVKLIDAEQQLRLAHLTHLAEFGSNWRKI